jgi:hypothetical protein
MSDRGKHNSEGIALSESNYARKILEKGGMLECNPCQIPLETRLKLGKESENQYVDATGYRSLVVSLKYLVHTRLDLAFTMGYVRISVLMLRLSPTDDPYIQNRSSIDIVADPYDSNW